MVKTQPKKSYWPQRNVFLKAQTSKKKKKKDISNGGNLFKEQEDLPDSWSILIERAGLWGAESSLKE